MANHFLARLQDHLPLNIFRLVVNFWPPLLGAGIKITKVTPDYRHIEVELRLRWYNKNYVGTHFGGSIFAMTDPFMMLMLIKNLGNDYIIWDKAASIDFKKPGRSTIKATFTFSEDEINQIKTAADQNGKYVFDRPVDVIDNEGNIIASVIRTLYVRRKDSLQKPSP
jgi:acyl-coenzyme A thioesterase PaaI-like protein